MAKDSWLAQLLAIVADEEDDGLDELIEDVEDDAPLDDDEDIDDDDDETELELGSLRR